MSPGQGEEVQNPMEEGAQGASPEAPPAGPPPGAGGLGGPLEGTEETVQPKAVPSPEELAPHLNLRVHNCGTVTVGAPPAKCPGCQRLSPEGEWLLYKVALV